MSKIINSFRVADIDVTQSLESTVDIKTNSIDTIDNTDLIIQRNNLDKISIFNDRVRLEDNVLDFNGTGTVLGFDIQVGGTNEIEFRTSTSTTTFVNNVAVNGNLNVLGTTTTINTASLSITDNIICANAGPSGFGSNSGFAVERFAGDVALNDPINNPPKEEDTAAGSGGGNNTIQLANSANNTETDFYKGYYIELSAGTGADLGNYYLVASYDESTRTITVDRDWVSGNPDNTTQYKLYNKRKAGLIYDETNDVFDLIYFPDDTNNLQSDNIDFVSLKVKSLETEDALSFTDLLLSGTTPATNPTTGTLRVVGGVGIQGSTFVGTGLDITPNSAAISGDISAGGARLLNASSYTITDDGLAGNRTNAKLNQIESPSIQTGGNAITFDTPPSTLYIGAPVAGTNVTFTNSEKYALEVEGLNVVGNGGPGTDPYIKLGNTSITTTTIASGDDILITAESGGTVNLGSVLKVQDGTVLNPSIVFNSDFSAIDDTNTGLFRSGADQIGFSILGSEVAHLEQTKLKLVNGYIIEGGNMGNLILNVVSNQKLELQVAGSTVIDVDGNGLNVQSGKISAGSANLELNAPTGQFIDFQVNNGSTMTVSDSSLIMAAATTITGEAGNPLTVNSPSGQDLRLSVGGASVANVRNNEVELTSTVDLKTLKSTFIIKSSADASMLSLSETTGTFLQDLVVSGTTTSTSSATGALQVAGGAGIAENVNVGGDVNVAGNVNVAGSVVSSGLRISKNIQSSDYTATANDSFVVFDTAAVLTLPNSVSSNQGQKLVVVNQSTGTVTINTGGSDNFDGSILTTLSLTTQHDRVVLLCDGAGIWYTI
jgi:hypothetical protein